MATSQIEYYFRRGRKDTTPGILVIHKKFELIVNITNREKTTFWYACKYRKTKGILCGAKASIVKIDEGKFIMKECMDEHSHPGCASDIIAEDIKIEMCSLVETTPENPVSEARKTVILKYAEIYFENPDLWGEIVLKIGDYDALDKRLLRARQKVIGKAPINRNDFEPSLVLGDNDDIIVLDSNNLPDGWKESIEQQSELSVITPSVGDDAHGGDDANGGDDAQAEEDEDHPEDTERVLPKRVIIFTSPKLLKLFEENDGKSSVDGTFKAIPVLWKQMFIWMIRFSGFWIPVAWGWLPDKSLQSYKVFFYMMLEELKRRNIPLNIKEFISDFELNILKSADEMLPGIFILGCFFHISKAIWKKVQVNGFASQNGIDYFDEPGRVVARCDHDIL